jgi:hypothetical protein
MPLPGHLAVIGLGLRIGGSRRSALAIVRLLSKRFGPAFHAAPQARIVSCRKTAVTAD